MSLLPGNSLQTRLTGKCRQLCQENEDLAEMIDNGRLAGGGGGVCRRT